MKRTFPSASSFHGKAWAGRFSQGADKLAEAFSSSLAVDIRLLPVDIEASRAHAAMLGKQGILQGADVRRLHRGLARVLAEWREGKLKPQLADEDVHMLVERRLHELIGPVAGKLHTARSRNDQVITDLKLYLRLQVGRILQGLKAVQQALVAQAAGHVDWIMPGYTHMQVAQPVLLAHWLLAHTEAFYRDERRFSQLLQGSLDELPLGAAALAGTGHPIDRREAARQLGFARVTENSLDTVGDRDFCVEFLSAAALVGVHLSKLGEELVWFSNPAFGFVTVGEGYATGSSIMPQKRNPDIAELLRSKAGRLAGDLMSLLTLLKGLPHAYNRDLQEDKEPVFDAADTLTQSLPVLSGMLQTLAWDRGRLEAACGQGYPTATEAADHLVRQGVPFREAHAVVGRIVKILVERRAGFDSLVLTDWKAFHPQFQPSILEEVSLARSVRSKQSWGGTAPEQVVTSLRRHENRLGGGKKRKKTVPGK